MSGFNTNPQIPCTRSEQRPGVIKIRRCKSCPYHLHPGWCFALQILWHKDISGAPFPYAFLDEEVQKQYVAEISLSRIITSSTGMAILISCLGLFGLTVVCIALVTISFQAIRAAVANPVKSLRDE